MRMVAAGTTWSFLFTKWNGFILVKQQRAGNRLILLRIFEDLVNSPGIFQRRKSQRSSTEKPFRRICGLSIRLYLHRARTRFNVSLAMIQEDYGAVECRELR